MERAVLNVEKANPLVLYNVHGSGHFFVDYDSPELKEFRLQSFVSGNMPAEGRINTLNDLLLLSRGGREPLITALEIVKGMEAEERFTVWSMASRVIASASHLTEEKPNCRGADSLLQTPAGRSLVYRAWLGGCSE